MYLLDAEAEWNGAADDAVADAADDAVADAADDITQ
jgi:hypothetical protein